MFVALARILDLLVAPLTWSLLLLAAAAVLRRRGRLGWWLATAGAAVLLVFATQPVANALYRWAEAGAVRTARPDVTYDAVVVLGGSVDPAASRASGRTELDAAADRVVRALELWREGRARAVLLSGGLVHPVPGEPSEAERLAGRLVAWGVPGEAIAVEGRSRNTRENAVESARIVRERGWRTLVLVTSAAHMPRALGAFRAVGLTPDAEPVDARAGDGVDASWLPRASALSDSTDALRELAGRVAYRVAGYSE